MTVQDLRQALDQFAPHDKVAVDEYGTDVAVMAPQVSGPRCRIVRAGLVGSHTPKLEVKWPKRD